MWVSYLSHYCLAVTSQLPAKTLPPLLVRSLLCMSGKNLKIFANSQQQLTSLLFWFSVNSPLFSRFVVHFVFYVSLSISTQVRLFIHCACQFAHFLSAELFSNKDKIFFYHSVGIFSLGVWWNIFCLDFMLCIKLWRENWWSCFLSIQCFSFFTPRNKHEKQVVLPLLSGVTPAGPRHPSHSPLCGGVRGSISLAAVSLSSFA